MIDQETSIREQVEARCREEADALADPEAVGSPEDPRFIADCLANNERGDGLLFASIHRDQYVLNKTSRLWYRWTDHHWEIDRADYVEDAVEQVALRYQAQGENVSSELRDLEQKRQSADDRAAACKREEDEAGEMSAQAEATKLAAQSASLTNKRKAFSRRSDKLRTVRGIKNCLEKAHTIGPQGLYIYGDEIDRRPMLLPCKNGVIDLETGKLLRGNPRDYLVRGIPIDYHGIDHHNAHFDNFLEEIHQGDTVLAQFVLRYLGYCLTGLTTEQHLACFIGEGANGKGTLFETMHAIMGELSWSIEPEMILEQKNAKSSAGPSPDIVSLHGRRLVIASETDQNRRISGAKVKRLTGSDTLTGRAPHDKFEINFQPTHKLVLYTNHPPKGLAADFALFRRLLYIYYPLRYVDDVAHEQRRDPQNADLYRAKDSSLPRRLLENPSGILSALVRGCLHWQKHGLQPPESLRAAAEQLRRNEDHLERFISAACQRVPSEMRVTFKIVYDNFKRWYEENVDEGDRYRPSKKAITDQLRRKGYQVPPAKETGGTTYVYGLAIEGIFA